MAGTTLPPLRDHHVHLGLIDTEALRSSALSAVDDLGWAISESSAWKAAGAGGCEVRAAGPFLTKVGGYPTGRAWAPDLAVRQISSAQDAATAVAEIASAGLDMCKVALNSDMPLLDDRELGALVLAARDAGLPVVAHVEGKGQSRRAFEAGVDTLAHTPWSEGLDDALIADMAGMTWISTLNIHRTTDDRAYACASNNLAAFHGHGGRVLYGTDMGNGPTPVGLNPGELSALVEIGMGIDDIIAAMATVESSAYVTWSPLPPPTRPEEFVAWCASLETRTNEQLGAAE